jgi:GNAT superfamily N-acetyltransferase
MSGAGAACVARLATADDIDGLAALLVEMNLYYGDPSIDEASAAAALRRHVFAPASGVEMLVAESGGRLAGFASLSPIFPVDGVHPALYLKELFVSTRSIGVGRALLVAIARRARERGCVRVNWAAAADNTGALRFYEGLGATVMDNARFFELDAAGIAALLETAGD